MAEEKKGHVKVTRSRDKRGLDGCSQRSHKKHASNGPYVAEDAGTMTSVGDFSAKCPIFMF